ncbi:MAG: serine/threonine-protein kinase [Acidobacteriota bacterium]
MRHECPACHRAFDEPGFCPFDGKPLESAAERQTLLSESLRAQSESETIEHKVVAVSRIGDETGRAKAALRERVNEYDALVGQTLDGRYFVQKKLGEGGMGVVFAAKHAVIERPLAIKVLKREATRDTATIHRFVQEAKAASRIGHPNIVDVTDFGTTPDGLTYSVMEHIDGTTLADVIKAAAPLPADRAVRIAVQIARALAAAHDKGIVHRDLKPGNVFLIDRDGRPDFVKIVDFGIAKVQPIEGSDPNAPRLTRTGAVFGTPEYMAPEQAAGRSDTDRRVDIYALGTILYQMLVGKVPHKGGSMVRTIAMQMLDPIMPPSRVDPKIQVAPALEAVVMKALAKDRDERYQTMGEFAAALDGIDLALPETLQLPSLPPGADTGVGGPPRRSKPATRQLHEPEFVAGPLSLHTDFEPLPAERPSRLPWILAALAVLAAGGATIVVLAAHHGGGEQAASAPRDAAGVAEVHADAAPIAEVSPDAALAAAPDAAVAVAARGSDPILQRPDGPVATVRGGPHPATVVVEVLTRPADTDVFVGHVFRGPSGVRLEERYGTKLTIECRAPHFKGTKQIVFDGSVTSVMCTATRLKMCVEGLKNPYDECEEPEGSSQGPIVKPD